MTISIIIPALNEALLIGQSVARAWETGPHEVLVADGGSDDGTADAARAAGAIVVTAPRGRASQQNAAARRALGDTLLFLHADTWLARDGLRQIEQVLAEGHVESGAFHQRIEAERRIYRLVERGNAWRAARRGLPYGYQGIFVRRHVFDELGGFPELRLMEDLMLMKRLRRRSRPVLLPGPLYVSARRWEHYGVVRQTARNWLLLAAAGLGADPNRLARFYPEPSAKIST
ncbi:MAG TPA: TIGR04283 family arsenosugar biosynthesis glycosyltransferase [Pirellulales bacterium]|jgi:rSAM/selenodomain-associated transferase 2|nr:TIGR04283 family arsenosugar biosynthesis glycosyltransferase [Pirellulales bacterium]